MEVIYTLLCMVSQSWRKCVENYNTNSENNRVSRILCLCLEFHKKKYTHSEPAGNLDICFEDLKFANIYKISRNIFAIVDGTNYLDIFRFFLDFSRRVYKILDIYKKFSVDDWTSRHTYVSLDTILSTLAMPYITFDYHLTHLINTQSTY